MLGLTQLALTLSPSRGSGGTPAPSPSLDVPVVTYADDGTATITNYDAAVTYAGVRDDATTFSIIGDTFTWTATGNVGFFVAVAATRSGYTGAQSDWHFTPEDLLQWRSDFNGTVGTDLNGHDGWAGYNYFGPPGSGNPSAPGSPANGLLKLSGGGALAQYVDASPGVFIKAVTGNDYEIEAEMIINPASNKDGNNFRISARDKGIGGGQTGASRVQLFYEGNGNYSYAGSSTLSIGRNFATGDKMKLRVLGTRAYVYLNGIRPAADVTSNGRDVSAIGTGTFAGLVGSNVNGGGTWPFDRMASVELRTVKSYTFMLNAAVVTNEASLTTTLQVDASVLHADISVIDQNGFQIAPIQLNVAPSSPGIFPVNVTMIPSAGGKTARIVARDTANPAHASVIDIGVISAWQSTTPIMALNVNTPLANYSTTNLMHVFRLVTNPATVGMTDAGDITIMPVGGLDFVADYDWPDTGSPVYATYLWTFSNGCVPTVSGSGVSIANITATTAEVTFAYGVNNPRLFLNGTFTGNLISTLYRAGLTVPQKARFYRPEAQTYYAPFAGYRFLFTLRSWSNSAQAVITTVQSNNCLSWNIPNKAAPCPAVMTDLGAAGKEIVFNVSANWAPSVVRSYVASLLADCAAMIHYRFANEIWNSAQLPYYIISRATPNFSAGTLALNEGDWVKGATSGYTMYVKRQTIKTGTVGGSDAAGYIVGIDEYPYSTAGFTTGETLQLCDASGSVLNANIGTIAAPSTQNIKYARHALWLYDLVTAIPGASARFVFGVEWMFAGVWADVTAILDEENLYAIVKETDLAPYGNSWLASWANVARMSQAQKTSWANDPVTNAAVMDAAYRADVDIVGADYHSKANLLAQYNVSKGLGPDDNVMGTYEVSPNGQYVWDWPSIKTNTGIYQAVSGDYFRGRTSGLVFRLDSSSFVPTGGTTGGGNQTGYFGSIKYVSGVVRYPVSGEIFDKVDPSNTTTVLTSAVFKAADATNLNYTGIVAHCDYMKSAAYGATWAYYIDTYLSRSGTHKLFCEGYGTLNDYGERVDVFNEWQSYGFWGIGALDSPAYPYTSIVAAI